MKCARSSEPSWFIMSQLSSFGTVSWYRVMSSDLKGVKMMGRWKAYLKIPIDVIYNI